MIKRIVKWIEKCGFEKDPGLWQSLIKEEVTELDEAITLVCLDQGTFSPNWDKTDKHPEILDALGDLLWVTIGMIHNMGYDPEEVLRTIAESNESKFCYNLQDAKASVNRYVELGTDAYYWLEGDKWVIKRMSDHKVLKGINFKEPDWSWVKAKKEESK